MIRQILQNISHKYASKWLVMLFDLSIVAFTFIAAYVIRYNFILDFDFITMFKQIPFVFLAALLSFMMVGSYKGVVRFTGFKDVINIIIGVNILATILIISTFFSRRYHFDSIFNISGSIIYIHLLLNILFLVGFKLFIKSIYNKLMQDFKTQTRILVFGAGSSGMITYDAITNDPRNSHIVVGFIDDNESKIGKKINTLSVYSLEKITPAFVEKQGIEEVIISIQNIESTRLLQVSGLLFELGLKVKIVPPVQHWIDGDLSIGQIKDVNIEDLLGRDPISITNPACVVEYENQIILITGAAGSIGSEIARKASNYAYKKLILLDSAESPLYELQQEFVQKGIKNFIAVVADVRDFRRMERLFHKHKPKIVFHAAAYKHVPLMENNPYEAVSVNIAGTRHVASLSVKHGVNKFVLISTDKAVNPTNVMGATKRIAELYVNCLQGKGKTKFITTRFGNVLGSNGSVIPLFKKQIDAGGPLTVTHKEITRFFMTISEACQLVLEAATMGNGGEIFVFDMGKSVKIFDLAKNMIILSGLRYPEDIDIKITGLRPGEKIYEELLADGENTRPTYHDKIMIAKTKDIDVLTVSDKISNLCTVNSKSQTLEIVSLIKDLVPEYISNNSKYEVLDSND
ncbi:nucleoside-diphosphate sugar epimerase/dehydratase [Psychroserpens sp.]|uniref:polysaccharide biosynthesis protein n=1 Tax=Psychroserpens sp. TaxID=2020870 RepID=UPI001B1DA655|nr:nucleoside-diphosphate sugar epimerase/dehydratase [Psychroserpens sp.]MBO6606491.1 polysaccharide biosynthesis protein [Psychroserpens sp.]MBO6632396.1 polysaccharide biosynthesis protein [Psychroserpens sp.]MBO6653195.1 polysaccharide biosynthesis protein [Psychroserpens sp.]MBO6680777.1 polysaccharide biosynthesis protein [Psychroserpens sp.]MBO6750265.1 polysaccharide biosynthesis protein [Psychroserpens sp.]